MELQQKAKLLVRLVGRYNPTVLSDWQDWAQEAALVLLEIPDATIKEQLRELSKRVYRLTRRSNCMLLTEPASYTEEQEAFAQAVIDYYRQTDYTSTVNAFRLQDTMKLRKLLSSLCPKPGKGKASGNYVKVLLDNATPDQMHTASRTTLWRAKQRGYFYAHH
jgi:hypothetical protein